MEGNITIVDTPSGKLQGSFERSCLGDNYYSFKGIPYAKPPVGKLRFRDPQALEPWTGIRTATSYGPISAQYDFDLKKVIGSEDCLYLNVYTRNLNASSRSPVMCYVPGGGYIDNGNDDYFGPDYLLTKDVVLVTINYRIGLFGFFDLRDNRASGNQGLKDQVMALKWVQSHIINFGGDPDNVTMFGQSAGAGNVHLLAVSQMTKGLFHKVILQSATTLSPLAMQRIPNEEDMFGFLHRLDIREKTATTILESLSKLSFERLIEAQTQDDSHQRVIRGKRLFLPTVDDKSDEPFMSIPTIEATNRGIQVPLMIGFNDMECLMYLECGFDLNDVDQHLENYTPFIDDLLRANNLTLKELRYLYFKNEPINEKNLSNLVKYWTDLVFAENVHRFVKIQTHCSSAPTYLYKFTYDKNPSLFKKKLNTTIEGPTHGDELVYLFKMKLYDKMNMEQLPKGTGADRLMKQMVELWTNFAKTGRPTLEKSDLLPLYWLPVTDNTVLRYLNIGEELHMEKELNIEQHYSYKKSFA